MFGRRQEQELVEIGTLARDLNRRVHESVALVERISQAQRQLRAPGRPRASASVDDADAEPLLAFVHIPKTAGATVTSMFSAAYTREGVHKAGNFMRGPEKSLRKIGNWYQRGGRVSVGHIPYGAFRDHLPADTVFMTFLREPVDRVLSHYSRHIRREVPRYGHRAGMRPGGARKANSIEEALVDMRMPELNNLATRFLCGCESPMGELPASALDDAMENLRGFAFVGIQERFEESMVLLQRMLGLEAIPYEDRHVSSEGTRPSVDEIPERERELIVEHNRLDAELYRFGLGLFEDAVAGADEGFAAEVEALRARSAEERGEEWRQTALPAPRVAGPR
jgi:Sulfotransferase family